MSYITFIRSVDRLSIIITIIIIMAFRAVYPQSDSSPARFKTSIYNNHNHVIGKKQLRVSYITFIRSVEYNNNNNNNNNGISGSICTE